MKVFANFFKDDWYFFNYRLSIRINGLLYFLRRVPGINKLFNEDIYQAYDLKQVIGILLTVLSIGLSFLKKFLVLGGAVVVHWSFLSFFEKAFNGDFFSGDFLKESLMVWFLLVVVGWSFYNQFSVIATQKMLDFYQEFTQSKTRFILGQKFVEVLKSTIFYLPAGFVYGWLAGQLSIGLFIPLVYFAGNFFYFVICRWHYLRGYSKWTRRLTVLVMSLIFLALCTVLYRFDGLLSLEHYLTSWLALLLLLVVGFFSFKRAWDYPRQDTFITRTIQQSDDFYQLYNSDTRKNQEYIGQGLKMQKQLELNQDQRLEHLKGSEYLNALLFSRYRQVFNKKIRSLLLGFGAVAAILVLLRIFNLLQQVEERGVVILLPTLFFIMYFISFGKQIVQMLFVNCDSSMLYYPFYRESATILTGFTYRLRKIFGYNSLIVVGIFLLFIWLQVLNNFFLSWQFFATLLLLLLALAFLFSFHELFIYYLLQPFTGDMTVRSPLYKVLTWVFYYFAYINTQLRFSGFIYVIGISIISLLYVGIGLIVIYRVAPKTFKVKN